HNCPTFPAGWTCSALQGEGSVGQPRCSSPAYSIISPAGANVHEEALGRSRFRFPGRRACRSKGSYDRGKGSGWKPAAVTGAQTMPAETPSRRDFLCAAGLASAAPALGDEKQTVPSDTPRKLSVTGSDLGSLFGEVEKIAAANRPAYSFPG